MSDTPQPDDIADTLTASYRTMKEVSAQMEAMTNVVSILNLVLALAVALGAFYLARKVLEHE